MLDAQDAVAAPAAVRREDYRPPDWLVPEISLEFELDAERTLVRAALQVERNGAHDRSLRLDIDGPVPVSLLVDGTAVQPVLEDEAIVITLAGRPGM